MRDFSAEDRGPIEPRLVTIPQAGRALSVGHTTVYDLIESGRIRSVRIGRRHLVPVSELDRFVAELVAEGQVAD